MYMYTHIRVYAHVCLCMHMYTFKSIHKLICICVYIYEFLHTKSLRMVTAATELRLLFLRRKAMTSLDSIL